MSLALGGTPSGALDGAVDLLDRSLWWTCSGLAAVTADRLGDPTPCAQWDLAALLHHMDDALDAFTEAATGEMSLVPTAPRTRLHSIGVKAHALLGWWSDQPPEVVRLGDATLPARLLVDTAALEIAVHGWDLHRTLGTGRELPESLADSLLPVAALTVGEADRVGRFAPALPVSSGASLARQLLAHLGRR